MNWQSHLKLERFTKKTIHDHFQLDFRKAIITYNQDVFPVENHASTIFSKKCCEAFSQDSTLLVQIHDRESNAWHEYFWTRVAAALNTLEILFLSKFDPARSYNCTEAVYYLSDHINLSGHNPLIGPNDESWGPRFPDMSFIYTPWPHNPWPGTIAVYPGNRNLKEFEKSLRSTFPSYLLLDNTIPGVITARHSGLKIFALSFNQEIPYPSDFLTPWLDSSQAAKNSARE